MFYCQLFYLESRVFLLLNSLQSALLKIIISKCSPKGYKKNKNINLALANTINLIIFHMNIYSMEKKLGPILMVGKMINCIEYGFGKKKEKEYNIR